MDGIRKKKRSDAIHPHQRRKGNRAVSKNRVLLHSEKTQIQNQQPTVKRKRERKIMVKKHHEKKNNFLLQFFSFLKRKRKLLKWLLFLFLYLYILFVIFNKINRTEISLHPRQEIINEDTVISLHRHPDYAQLGFSIIAVKASGEEKLEAREERMLEEKAHGFVTLFNDYSTEPQKLSPHTRFQSVSGKIFKLGNSAVVIPGKKNGKAGSVRVEVYAEKAGPEYNIDMTDFSLPGFKEAGLDEKYRGIYAVSLKTFSGGFRGKKKVVGEDEKKRALKTLEEKLKNQLLEKLERKKTERVLMVKDSLQIVYHKPSFHDGLVKEEAQLFALIVGKKQLETYLKRHYFPKVQRDDFRVENLDTLAFDYKGKKINFAKVEKVPLHFKGKIHFIWNIDTNLVKKSLLGLPFEQVKLILREFEEIQSARIHVFPFWQKHISDLPEKIFLEIKT